MDDAELKRWRAALATLPPADVPAERLWALAEGSLSPEDAAAVVDQLSAAPGSLYELALASAIIEEIEAEVIRPRFGGPRRWALAGAALAAAAALLLWVRQPAEPDGPGPMRGAPVALVTPLAAEQPLPRDAFTLRWEMPAGSHATVEIFDHLMVPLGRSPLLEEGQYTVPAALLPTAGRIFWQVRLMQGGQETITTLQPQRIAEGER